MSFNTQSTSKFAVLEFGAGTQPKQTAAPKKSKEIKKKDEKSTKATASASSADSEGEGKVIENLILSTLSTDGV